MSKTDKTKPPRVKLFENKSFLAESHDHRDGVCDLPPRPTRYDSDSIDWSYGAWNGTCRWRPTRAYWDSPEARCPCYMCHGSWWESPHKHRHDAKRYCRDGWRDEY